MKLLKNQRGVIDIILILVIVIAAMAFGGYVYYQQRQAQQGYDKAGNGVTVSKHAKKKTATTPVSTAGSYADWKTYSSKLGFTIKYPSGYTLLNTKTQGYGDVENYTSIAIAQKSQANMFAIMSPASSTCKLPEESLPDCAVKVEAILYAPVTTSLTDWTATFEKTDPMTGNARTVLSTTTVQIGGVNGIKKHYAQEGQSGGDYDVYYVVSGSKAASFNVYPGDTKLSDVAEKIINSFTFTK